MIEGRSYSLFARACGLTCFLAIGPVFIYSWLYVLISNPAYLRETNLLWVIGWGFVSVLVLVAACWGLILNFATTRVTEDAVLWSLLHYRQHIPLQDIQYVDKIFYVFTEMHIKIVQKNGKVSRIAGGTPELKQAFFRLRSKYPRRGAGDSR